MQPVRMPSDNGTTTAVAMRSNGRGGDDVGQYGPVKAEAMLAPSGEIVTKTWDEDLAEYVTLLAVETLHHGGGAPETLDRLLNTYANEVRAVHFLKKEGRVYSDAIILRFWKNESGRLNYTAEASPTFPTDLIPLAHKLGEMTVRMSDKMAKP